MNLIGNLMLDGTACDCEFGTEVRNENNFHVIRRTYTTRRNIRCNLGVQWRLCLDVTSDLNAVVNNLRTHARAPLSHHHTTHSKMCQISGISQRKYSFIRVDRRTFSVHWHFSSAVRLRKLSQIQTHRFLATSN